MFCKPIFFRPTIYRQLCVGRSREPINIVTATHVASRLSSSSSSSETVLVEDRGKVRLIGINRPEKRNCVNRETAIKLRDEFDRFDADDTVSVAVLHGIGGTFCAGYDLSELSSIDEMDEKNEAEIRDLITRGPMGPSQMLLSKPVVAAINGYAVAGGIELALWCDLRVMETNAVMGVFCRRFGVPLIDGGTVRLPALIGLSRAMDLILTGRPINGKEAFDFGLANRLVPTGTALGQAYNLANSLVKFPQQCMAADRSSAYYAAYGAATQDDALRYEFENARHVILSESIKGATKFAKGGVGRHGKFVLDKFDHDVEVTA